ncbi:MAG: U32 family peptidase [Deltaproteobacteria bacterium]|nr:U32 family peptidase [Deltaproteobacteria bacterium]
MAQDSPRSPAPSSGSSERPIRPEVLAPAGDLAALRAALAAGADAVYFGLDDGFNARARAQNFPLAELRSVVARVHRAGAKAYVTLNTLVFEPELSEVERIVRGVAAAGADAIIVQDPAVALLARALCPELEVHASTQMTVASAQGAQFAKDLGATRFVVPRELSVDEIRALSTETDLELEVFVHGALCVSWSGQCLTSEAWGGRSANRGQCAQSCRMPYALLVDGQERDLGDVKYLLSPKDLAGARAVPELAAIGVHGLKIEGRQKGPQYVATATAGYRRWVDAIVSRRGDGAEEQAEARLAADLQGMGLSYTRGFGDGFLVGSDHQTLVEGRFPKHRGLLLGRVTQVRRGEVQVEPDDREGRPWTGALAKGGERTGPQGTTKVSLPILGGSAEAASGPRIETPAPRPGMGVVFDAGEPEDKQEPGGPIFRAEPRPRAGGGRAWVLGFGDPGPDLSRVRVGQRVWITQDPTVARAADRVVETAPDGRIPLVLGVSGREGAPLRVHARVLGDRPLPAAVRALTAAAESEATLSRASARGLDEPTLRDKLGALGGTPFHLARLDASSLSPGLHLPISELKPLRRALVEALAARIDDPTREVAKEAIARVRASIPEVSPRDEAPIVVPLCRSDEQLDAAIEAGVSEVELDWMELVGLSKAFARAKQAGLRVVAGGLRVEKPGEEGITERIARLIGASSEGCALSPDGVLVRHWGAFTRFTQADPRPFLVGDFSLNVTNSITARHLLSRGLDVVTASFDLDDEQLFGLVEATPRGRVAVVVHHRIPTFHTEHCLYAHLLSEGRDHRTCGRPCEQRRVDVRDHLGHEHPVIVDAGCRNTIFNHEPQSAAALVPGLLARGVRRFRVDFVRESRREARVILDAYRALVAGERTPAEVVRTLSVRDQFGVGAGRRTLLGAPA